MAYKEIFQPGGGSNFQTLKKTSRIPQMDTLDSARRSENMRRIRDRDTKPELTVRVIVRSLGFTGYRLHRKDLPGKPDLAWIGRKKAIYVHGCFWHGHNCKEGLRKPKSNTGYWIPKIERNKQRDAWQIREIESYGWRILIVRECELKKPWLVEKRIRNFFNK